MNNRRSFIKQAGLGLAALHLERSSPFLQPAPPSFTFDYWLWQRPNLSEEESLIKKRFQSYKEAGIRGLMFENYSRKHFQLAKEIGFEAHRWMWTMNRGVIELLDNHPEYYAFSRYGKYCANIYTILTYYRIIC